MLHLIDSLFDCMMMHGLTNLKFKWLFSNLFKEATKNSACNLGSND
jgi:hypothetical protein